jgi:glycylpeptide N-tetradecanoyltransferase
LLQTYLDKFEVKLKFSEQEVKHMFLSSSKVVHAFVIENKEKKQITDFVSFYNLPSTVLKKTEHEKVNVNYLSIILLLYRPHIHFTT